MSSHSVTCPHCGAPIAITRRTGRGSNVTRLESRAQACDDPNQPNVALLVCGTCNGVTEWRGKKVLIVDATPAPIPESVT